MDGSAAVRMSLATADGLYYTLIGEPSVNLPDRYIRIASGGVYSRWDPTARVWVHIPGNAGRDYLSRLIENGDGIIPSTPEEIAALR